MAALRVDTIVRYYLQISTQISSQICFYNYLVHNAYIQQNNRYYGYAGKAHWKLDWWHQGGLPSLALSEKAY